MSIPTGPAGTILIILIMALVTLVTRFGGVFLMSFVRISPRIESFINAMASSVLIAILTPMAMDGDLGAKVSLGTTAALILIIRRPLPAISGGILAAALVRQLL